MKKMGGNRKGTGGHYVITKAANGMRVRVHVDRLAAWYAEQERIRAGLAPACPQPKKTKEKKRQNKRTFVGLFSLLLRLFGRKRSKRSCTQLRSQNFPQIICPQR